MNPFIFAGLKKQAKHGFKNREKLSPLMKAIEETIKKSGGYYIWRDMILMENISCSLGARDDRQRIKVRLRNHEHKNQDVMNLKQSQLKTA